ncbi:MAG: 4-hydroxy-tetrahydrodipicolinate reductase [Hyphomonadaceae bacterium]
MTLALAIAGAAGRMGKALICAANEAPDMSIAGATERPGAAILGEDAGRVAGLAPLGAAIVVDPAEAAAKADVWLDFTAPAATIAALATLEKTAVRAAILGTTGLDEAQEAAIAAAAKRLAIVRSGNFSLGVNLLAALVEDAARRLKTWDIEISEAHHRRKVDAPSGTALLLGEAAAKGRGAKLKDLRIPPNDGVTGPRKEGAIGFSAMRGGGIVGEHDVLFAAEREYLRLSHVALDRAVFADGALVAARWAAAKPPGLYSMRDVLGL